MGFGIEEGMARIVLLLMVCVWSGNGEELDAEGGSGMLISGCSCRGGISLEDNKGMSLAKDPPAEMSALPCLRSSDASTLVGAVGMGKGGERWRSDMDKLMRRIMFIRGALSRMTWGRKGRNDATERCRTRVMGCDVAQGIR